MLFASSVIRRTGQWWKVAAAFWAIILGSGLVWYHAAQIGMNAPERLPVIAMLGCTLILIGFLIAWMAVRCQSCGARWIWIGMTDQDAGNWVNWLAQSKCPQCHK
jgi:hypothetical protein